MYSKTIVSSNFLKLESTSIILSFKVSVKLLVPNYFCIEFINSLNELEILLISIYSLDFNEVV